MTDVQPPVASQVPSENKQTSGVPKKILIKKSGSKLILMKMDTDSPSSKSNGTEETSSSSEQNGEYSGCPLHSSVILKGRMSFLLVSYLPLQNRGENYWGHAIAPKTTSGNAASASP